MNSHFSEPEGSVITTNIPFATGEFVYSVFTSTDKLTDDHPSHSGIIISKNNNFLANVNCKDDSIQGNLLDLDKEP